MSVWFETAIEQMLKILKSPLSRELGSNVQLQKWSQTLIEFTPNKLVTFDDRDPLDD